MSHSYSNNLIHLVFSTKDRQGMITSDVESRLWEYMIGIGRHHRIMVFAAGGMNDHVHLLYNLPTTMSLADSIRILKANSSRWMRNTKPFFGWQKGFGAFSVSTSNKAIVMRYIGNQKRHHESVSFEQEFVTLLKKHGITYDPIYVFG
jgi:putative transposase